MKINLGVQKKFNELPELVQQEYRKRFGLIIAIAFITFFTMTIGFRSLRMALMFELIYLAVAAINFVHILRFLRDEVYEFKGTIIEMPNNKKKLVKKIAKSFNQYCIIVKTEKGGNLKVHVAESFRAKNGNKVVIYAPVDSCFNQSEMVAEVLNYYFLSIVDY